MSNNDSLNLLSDLIENAKKAGADAADAILVDSTSISVTCRVGQIERLERSELNDIGLRVLTGNKQAIVASSDRAAKAQSELVERALAMAKTVPDDPYCGLADPGILATNLPALDVCDNTEIDSASLINAAKTSEDAARSVDGVTNSDGAQSSWGHSNVAIVASNGFERSFSSSGCSISASVIAGDTDKGMETDYDHTSAVYFSDLRDAADVGRTAGERAVRRLGARKISSTKVPVVFDPRTARGLVGHLINAINGAAIARGTSFLKDSMGEDVFGNQINIFEDPHRPRGLRSKPCDAEGLPNQKRLLIKNGILTSWLLDLRSARQLNMEPTGHAARGTSSAPSPAATNIYLGAGSQSPEDMISEIKEGLYVTDVFGQGVNMVSGDYSRGAAGHWIEGGEFSYPVNEITIAGNLRSMFKTLTPASDLDIQFGLDAPTVRLDSLSIAGT